MMSAYTDTELIVLWTLSLWTGRTTPTACAAPSDPNTQREVDMKLITEAGKRLEAALESRDRRQERTIADLRKQRDGLLAALEMCLPDLKHYASTHGPGPDRRMEQANAAIDKAKGG